MKNILKILFKEYLIILLLKDLEQELQMCVILLMKKYFVIQEIIKQYL